MRRKTKEFFIKTMDLAANLLLLLALGMVLVAIGDAIT